MTCLKCLAAVLLVCSSASGAEYGLMRPSVEVRHQWELERVGMDRVIIPFAATTLPTSMDLLPYLTYPQVKRNQGVCGNCWVWAPTAAVEVLAGVYGFRDALSVQYLTSGFELDACCGGTLGWYVSWYRNRGAFVSRSNHNANYIDGKTECGDGTKVKVSSISVIPRHPIRALIPLVLDTYEVGQDNAISSIKGVLAQNQPVLYILMLPDDSDWNGFVEFWKWGTEDALWRPDAYTEQPWNDGAGHMMTVVGYDDSDPNPARHYWTVLNSWGVDKNRPHGILRVAQNLNYDASYYDGDTKQPISWFATLNVLWSPQVVVAVQPKNVMAARHSSASFSVVAAKGTPPYMYQWRRNRADIKGANEAIYTISSVSLASAGRYSVVISDTETSTVSNDALLTVKLKGKRK